MSTIDWETLLPPWLSGTLPFGILATDNELRVRYWSPWLEQHSGRSAAEVLTKPLLELYPELRERRLDSYYRDAVAGTTVDLPQREHGYLLPMAPPANFAEFTRMQQRVHIAPLLREGELCGTLTTISDMTARVAQERRLQLANRHQEETLSLLDTLITKAPIGFAFVDTELRYRGINERLAEINGVSVADHLGRSLWEIVPDLAPQQIEKFHSVMASGEPLMDVDLSGETLARPGMQRYWQVSYYPVRTSDQRRLGVGLLVNEITERRRAEQLSSFMATLTELLTSSLDYQTTLERLANHLVPFLADWCVIDMLDELPDTRFTAVAHADPALLPVAQELQQRFAPQLDSHGALQRVFNQGQPVLTPELSDARLAQLAVDSEHLRMLKQLRPCTCMVVPLTTGGQPFGILSLARTAGHTLYSEADLAVAQEIARRASVALENVRLYAVAERSRATAEEAVRLRDAFFSIAAHELRTPLTTLLGRAQLIHKWLGRAQLLDERSLRAIRVVVEQAQRLNKMITALLDVSRIRTGRFSIEATSMDITALLRRVVEETRPTLSSHTLALHEEAGAQFVSGDELRLEQVFQNLISNAVKYSPDGGEVLLTVGHHNGQATVSVSDHGIGIPAGAEEQLFHRFYRAGNAESMGISGMGIGLFVVNEIVELHGGNITVASVEGEGSTFTVYLPLHTGDAAGDGNKS